MTGAALALALALVPNPEPFAYVRLEPDFGGRLLAWTAGPVRYAVGLPVVPAVAPGPGGGDALGLIHSGYSRPDPDGKNAVLNVTLQISRAALTPEERETARKAGLTFDDAVRLAEPQAWWLDVALPADAAEEGRLREALQWPRKVAAGDRIPVSIRWTGVPGRRVFGWLTDSAAGLRFVLRPDDPRASGLTILREVRRTASLDRVRLTAWWRDRAGDADTFRWRGGIDLLVADLAAAGALLVNGSPADPSAPESAQLAEKLKAAVTAEPSGVTALSKQKLLELPFGGTAIAARVTVVTPVLPETQPGPRLAANPKYIKDLSGTGVGLDPLKNDPDAGRRPGSP
jgi:hypothetical protein